jgi:hypothetical protein
MRIQTSTTNFLFSSTSLLGSKGVESELSLSSQARKDFGYGFATFRAAVHNCTTERPPGLQQPSFGERYSTKREDVTGLKVPDAS